MLAALFERRASIESPSTPLSARTLANWLGGEETHSGQRIDEHKALRLSTVWACVNVLAQTVASLPLILYRRLEPRGKERATSHPLYYTMHDRPHPLMSSYVWREILQGHLATWGNAYCEIRRQGGNKIVGLWPLLPDRTWPDLAGETKRLKTRDANGRERTIDAGRFLHVPGLGFDGIQGYSVIRMARQALGMGAATEEFGASWFGPNAARPAVVVMHPATMSEPAQRRFKESLEQNYAGPGRQHKTLVLEEGVKLEKLTIPPNDSQFLETRRFTVEEIARFYRMQLHKIGHLDKATFSNIEQQAIEFTTDTIRPWLVRWEQELNYALLRPEERQTHFFEFLVDGLLRGDADARTKTYAAGRQWGYLSANDVREMENRNPIEGGDIYMVPLNMIPADTVGLEPPSSESGEAQAPAEASRELRAQRSLTARRRIHLAQYRVILRAAERLVSQEAKAAARSLAEAYKSTSPILDFIALMERFYQSFSETIRRELLPIFIAYGELIAAEIADEVGTELDADVETFGATYTDTYAKRHIGSSMGQIRQLAEDAEDFRERMDARRAEWLEKRPEKIARNESVRAGNAFALLAFGVAGLSRLVWATAGTNCPLCNEMNGRTVGIQTSFLNPGDRVEAEGVNALDVDRPVHHPPLHRGCDCLILAR